MTENKKTIPENTENKPLTDDQLTGVTGGKTVIIVQPMGFKRCAANSEHVYVEVHDACPICGCKEFTRD